MKPGKVVQIRLNPMDCMGVVDVLDAARIDFRELGLSFPAMTSLALASLLQSARNANIIPIRDGFDYNKVMGDYIGTTQNSMKLIASRNMELNRANFDIPAAVMPISPTRSIDPAKERMVTLWKDFEFKRNNDKANMTAFEKEEWHRLFPAVFGTKPTSFDWDNESEGTDNG